MVIAFYRHVTSFSSGASIDRYIKSINVWPGCCASGSSTCTRSSDKGEVQRNGYTHFRDHRSINDGLLHGITEIVLRRTVRLLKHQHCRQFFDRVGP